jgi:hypothetical protein
VLVAATVIALATATSHAREVRTLTDLATAPPTGPTVDLLVPPPPPTVPTLDAITKAGVHWRFETERGPIHVWIPAGYDPATAATVVFVHGYHTDIDAAWDEYRLADQFALAGVNAMFIAGGAPNGKHSSVVWPSLTQLLASVAARIDVKMPKKRLVAIGHSGAYRTLALWLDNAQLDSIVLLDAVYGEYRFGPWVRDNKARRLINIVYETGRFCDYMHRSLRETIRVDGLPKDGLPDGRIIYAKTDAGHWALVSDGVAVPLSLRGLGLPRIELPAELSLGLPLRCDPKPTAPAPVPALPPAPPMPILPPLD